MSRPRISHIPPGALSGEVRELIAESHSVRQRIVTACAGLLEVNEHHEDERLESSDSVGDRSPLESENASLEPDNTSLSENASYRAEDMSVRSESEPLKSDNEFDDASSRQAPEKIRIQSQAKDHELFDLKHVTVDFIHRTARDFMQDPAQGGAFLKANTPSGLDPHVSGIKVLLVKVTLVVFRIDLVPVFVHDMMENLCLVEDETGVAQTQLCNLIDDVMSRIYRIYYKQQPTDPNWSSYWGDGRWRDMHEDLVSAVSKATSPSRSNHSFHSVNSQRKNPDDLTISLPKRADFLAFTVP